MKDAKKLLIAKIHIAKKDLHLDDDTYRDVLRIATGKDSCKDMSLSELKKVMSAMKQKGFVTKTKDITTDTRQASSLNRTKHGRRPNVAQERKKHLDQIEAVLAELGLPWAYAENTAKKMFGESVIEWLDDTKIIKLKQALLVYQKRQQDKKDKQ